MKRNLLWGLLLLFTSAAPAQPPVQIHVSGQITFGTPPQPAPFYPLEIFFPGQDSSAVFPIMGETDENGEYHATFAIPAGSDFIVSVYDFCTGETTRRHSWITIPLPAPLLIFLMWTFICVKKLYLLPHPPDVRPFSLHSLPRMIP